MVFSEKDYIKTFLPKDQLVSVIESKMVSNTVALQKIIGHANYQTTENCGLIDIKLSKPFCWLQVGYP